MNPVPFQPTTEPPGPSSMRFSVCRTSVAPPMQDLKGGFERQIETRKISAPLPRLPYKIRPNAIHGSRIRGLSGLISCFWLADLWRTPVARNRASPIYSPALTRLLAAGPKPFNKSVPRSASLALRPCGFSHPPPAMTGPASAGNGPRWQTTKETERWHKHLDM